MSRRTTIDQIENEHLRTGWLPETLEHGIIQAEAESDTPKSKRTWFASQVRTAFHLIPARVFHVLVTQSPEKNPGLGIRNG